VSGPTTSIVTQISDAVVTRLADAGYPPLQAGKILLGEQHLNENDATPKVVFVPRSSRYSSKDITSAAPLLSATPYTAEQLVEISNRPILTEEFTFEVHCWGRTNTDANPITIPDDDYNFARTLSHAVIAACDDLARGAYTVEPGQWTPSGVINYGREYVFGLTLMTPVLSVLLPFVPPGTVGQASMYSHVPGETPDELVTVIPLS
jgi:hypothetical protein